MPGPVPRVKERLHSCREAHVGVQHLAATRCGGQPHPPRSEEVPQRSHSVRASPPIVILILTMLHREPDTFGVVMKPRSDVHVHTIKQVWSDAAVA